MIVVCRFLCQLILVLVYLKQINFEIKTHINKAVVIGTLLYLAGALQYIFYNDIVIDNILFVAINLFFTIICVNSGVARKLAESLYLGLINWLSIELAEFAYVKLSGECILEPSIQDILLNAFILILFSLIIFMSSFIHKKATKTPLYFLIYPVASMITLSIILELSKMIKMQNELYITLIFAICTIVLSIVLTYLFFEKYNLKKQQLQLISLQKRETEISQNYYQVIEAQNEKFKQFAHDEKNLLDMILSLNSVEEIKEYVNSVKGTIKVNSSFGNTNNKVLDLIIGKYNILCLNKGIDLRINVKTSNLSFISNDDITSLMSNILDNAVESAEKSRKKNIELSINKMNGFDVISCRNSCDTSPNKKLETSKVEASCHGNGIKIIRRIIENYNGSMQWDFYENRKEFCLDIIFIHEMTDD